jgi:mannosyltransferase OCH1-like enzyme
MRRALPVYVACIIVFLFVTNVNSFGASIEMPNVFRRDVSAQKPMKVGHKFPKKIWQTWKVDPLFFEERDLNTAKTWTAKNPSYRYEVLTDNNDISYIEQHYGAGSHINRPDILEMYRSINATIIKADLLRYLIMYAEGGVYADIDVEALKPVEKFMPERFNEKDINMIIGVEIDQPAFQNHPILGKKSQSFCQWTFVCKPGQPVMLRLVENIIHWLKDVARKQNVPIGDISLDFDEVISGTGPSAFTVAILEDLSKRAGRTVSWHEFHDLDESKLINGVLVLNVEAFAAGQGHSDSGNHNSRGALVKHHYHASQWPSRHPRFSHPVFGEVEKCNWEPACVSKWDADTAAFSSLTEEEQQKQIQAKQAADVLPFPP